MTDLEDIDFEATNTVMECPYTIEQHRINWLVDRGFDQTAACIFAKLETEKRAEVARRHGMAAAILASVKWKPDGENGYTCELVLEEFPQEFRERVFVDFY